MSLKTKKQIAETIINAYHYEGNGLLIETNLKASTIIEAAIKSSSAYKTYANGAFEFKVEFKGRGFYDPEVGGHLEEYYTSDGKYYPSDVDFKVTFNDGKVVYITFISKEAF